MAKGFFRAENAGGGKVRMHINGIIGDWGNTSADVIWQIENQQAEQIDVYIQSPGGSAFEGLAMYNALRNHPAKVTTHILGAAASAGSIIYMAGDERVMPANTWLMIHEPSLRINGTARQLREAADFLDGMTQSLLVTYAPHVTLTEDEIMAKIMAETWINASDAVNWGFATTLAPAMEAVALASDFANQFENLPANLAAQPVESVINGIHTLKDFERTLRESGCSKQLATALVSKGKQLLQSESASELQALHNTLNTFRLK